MEEVLLLFLEHLILLKKLVFNLANLVREAARSCSRIGLWPLWFLCFGLCADIVLNQHFAKVLMLIWFIDLNICTFCLDHCNRRHLLFVQVFFIYCLSYWYARDVLAFNL